MIHTSRLSPSIKPANVLLVNLLVLFVLIFSPLYIQSNAVQANSSNYQEIESILYKHGEVIVRVYFDDAEQAREFGLGLEPMQSDYQKGYLVFHLTQEEYSILLSAIALTSMRVELDQALTRQYITDFKPRIAQPKLQKSADSQLSQMMTSPLDVSNYDTIPSFSCYRTVEGTFATAQNIVSLYPTLATWTDQGDSWEKKTAGGLPGYDLMVLKLTNSAIPGPKPKVFFTSSIHAREYTTAELMTRFASQLVENYGVDADTTWVLDHHEIHMMLTANPDGRKQAETGLLWRKNTHPNLDCGSSSTNRGVDLNRGFSFEWGCCGGSSTNGCNATYRGDQYIFSTDPAIIIQEEENAEPEASAVMNYLRQNFNDNRPVAVGDVTTAAPLDTMGLYIDVHSSGRLILWPWGFTSNPSPNSTQLQTLGRKLAFFNGHEPKQSIGLYPTDGTTTSFAYGELGLPAYTYELGTQFFENCSYFNNTLLPDNLPSLAYLIKTARLPYVLPAGPDVINQSVSPTSPTGVPASTQVTLSMTATDQRFNNTNGTEPSQTVVSAEYFLDTPPWATPAPIAIPMSLADGNSNSTIEDFVANIDTTGFSQGRHTLYIQATDQSGSTGVVSAVFLDIDDNAVLPITVFSDDFETDLGWLSNPTGSDTATTGQWQRANPQDTVINGGAQQLGTTVSGSFDLVTGPLAGTSVGNHDIDSGVSSIRSPAIDLPVSSAITLSFQSYLAHYSNSSSADYFRATISDGATSSVVFEELGSADQDNAAWQAQTIDITAYSGQNITILFEAADAATGSLVEAAVDDVEIIAVVGNQPPSVTNPGDKTNAEGSTVDSFTVVASDPENDPLTFSADLPAGLSINNTSGLVSGTLTAIPNDYPSSVTVSDGQGNDVTENFTWTVTVDNEAPVITNPGNQVNQEGDNSISVTVSASDADAGPDPLTFSDVGMSLPTGLSINPATGEIFGALDFESAGSYAVTIAVSDGIDSDSTTFNWTVNNVNRPPVFNQQIINQGNDEGNSVNLSASATDPDGDTLTYSASGLPDGVSINSTSGAISGTLSASSSGSYGVTVTATETNSGGLFVMQSFSWTVTDVNLPPIITNPGNQSSDEGTTITPLSIVADDPENAILTYSDASGSLPAGLSINSSTGVISGTLSAAVGSNTVTIEVSDGTNQSSTAFTWTITQVGNNEQILYLSSSTGGNVGGIGYSDEDIMTYNVSTSTWSKYIDGSDIGLSGSGARDINAFTVMNDGSVIFSVLGATTIPDVGAIDDSDLIRFIPTSLGTTTAGTFELYFDGSDVGLSSNGEDIDSVNLLANGNLLISTIGGHNVPGASGGQDEDLLLFTPTSLGASTSGSWSIYFDGSDVSLDTSGNEDVYATWMDESNGDIYLSTRSTFAVSGLSGDSDDIFICSPQSTGTTTDCNFSLFWDGDAFGYGSENIDGLFIE